MFNVQDFGAKPDGLTRADAAFTAALQAAFVQKSTVFMPAGNYLLDQVTLLPGVTLCGEGRGSVLQKIPGDLSPLLFVAAQCRVRELALLGAGTPSSTGLELARSAAHWSVRDVDISGFGDGIKLAYTWVGAFDLVRVWNCLAAAVRWHDQFVNAVQFRGGHYGGSPIGFHVTGLVHIGNTLSTTIEGCKEHGVKCEGGTSNLRLRDCYFESNGQADVLLAHRECIGTQIDGSTFYFTPVQVDVTEAKRTRIVGNFFHSTRAEQARQRVHVRAGATHTWVGPNHYAGLPFNLQVNRGKFTAGPDAVWPSSSSSA